LVDKKDNLVETLELKTVYVDSIQFKENILYIGCHEKDFVLKFWTTLHYIYYQIIVN